MIRPLYVIANWDLLYETYESARLARGCAWVAMPNKHDGRGYRRLIREKDGAALYGAWALIVQVASKCPVRGILADLDGPLDPLDLEDKTGIEAKVYTRTLSLVTSERIGWVRAVSEPGEITALLAEVTARRTHGTRKRPQTPAGSGHSPAGLQSTPAGCGQNGDSAGTPADSRESPHDNAPRVRALADRTGPDRTGPDTQSGVRGDALDALSKTSTLCLGILGKKRTRLGQDAEQSLAHHAADLPLSAEREAVLRWFYALPHDPNDIDLRGRYRDADGLAKNLFKAVERAEAYKARSGGTPEKKHAGVDVVALAQWFSGRYPDKPVPLDVTAVPEYILDEFRREVPA